MELVNLLQDLPTDQPRLRVYKSYVVLNSITTNLLGLQEGDYVKFTRPRITGSRPTVYVGKAANINGAFVTHKRHDCVRVNSGKLARLLQEALDGTGCYRVCPEDSVTDNGETFYNVFFRKYD